MNILEAYGGIGPGIHVGVGKGIPPPLPHPRHQQVWTKKLVTQFLREKTKLLKAKLNMAALKISAAIYHLAPKCKRGLHNSSNNVQLLLIYRAKVIQIGESKQIRPNVSSRVNQVLARGRVPPKENMKF